MKKIEKKKYVYAQIITDDTMKKYRLLKIRMKISYMAYLNNQTIPELFLNTI